MDPDEQAVQYAEFLAMARDEGLVGIDTQVAQAPHDGNGNAAIVIAVARTQQGGFGAVGEASPRSAPPHWHPFLVTLAELRAKARALRDLTGLEHAVVEELAVPYGESAGAPPLPSQPLPVRAVQRPAPAPAERPAPAPAERPAPAPAHDATTPGGAALGTRLRPVQTPADQSDHEDPAAGDEDEDRARAPRQEGRVGAGDADAMPDRVAGERGPAEPDEREADFEPITRDMESKLIKLATSIAALEADEITESEARQKLDDFFLRAFKHPLARATRIEGQRVVQRLSGDLSRLRTQGPDEKA